MVLGRIIRSFRGGGLVVHGGSHLRWRSHFSHRTLGESVGIALQRRDIGNRQVVHDFEGHAGFFFESGPRAAHGQHNQVERPENGDGPEDGVANGVPLAENASVPVDVVAGDSNNARIDREYGVGLNDHTVETQFHPALADEVAWILVIFETANEVAVGGKNGASVAFGMAKLTQDGIADGGGLGREFRF